jgi:hypothetical protein
MKTLAEIAHEIAHESPKYSGYPSHLETALAGAKAALNHEAVEQLRGFAEHRDHCVYWNTFACNCGLEKIERAFDALMKEVGGVSHEFNFEPRFGNKDPFDPNPPFYNHMIHWRPWAEHFMNQEGDIQTLALMFASALEEINRLCNTGIKTQKAQSELLFAYIELVETGVPRPFGDSSLGPWASLQILNQWRAENKLNIKMVDV